MEAVFRSYVLGFLPVTSWSFPAKNSLENVHKSSKHAYYSSENDRIPPGNIWWFSGRILRKFTKKYSYFMRKRSEFFRNRPALLDMDTFEFFNVVSLFVPVGTLEWQKTEYFWLNCLVASLSAKMPMFDGFWWKIFFIDYPVSVGWRTWSMGITTTAGIGLSVARWADGRRNILNDVYPWIKSQSCVEWAMCTLLCFTGCFLVRVWMKWSDSLISFLLFYFLLSICIDIFPFSFKETSFLRRKFSFR